MVCRFRGSELGIARSPAGSNRDYDLDTWDMVAFMTLVD